MILLTTQIGLGYYLYMEVATMFRTLSGADKSTRLAARAIYIPKGARLVPGPAGCAVYAYELAGKFYALAFRGTAAKPEFHHSYRTAERRQAHVAEFWGSVQGAAERKAARAAEKAVWVNPLKVGEILYTSWGYDQTNVEFFAVTRVSGRRVWVREIASDGEQTGFMSGRCWPAMPIRFVGDETMHTAQPSGKDGVYVKISECRTAWPEQGRAHGFSTYA